MMKERCNALVVSRLVQSEMSTWSETDSDAQLIDWATAGYSEAFAQLVGRHQGPIYAYLARRAGSVAAEDLLADVWMAAFRSRASFDARWGSARPWLFGIARNGLQKHWTRLRREESGEGEVSDPWPAVDDRLAASDIVGNLRAALNALSSEQREVLLLVAWEDLTPTEIALVIGIPASTVRSHLHRARRSLLGDARALSAPDTPHYCKEN
jgi:RNA polymerase sigma factor (sigma-70 family)